MIFVGGKEDGSRTRLLGCACGFGLRHAVSAERSNALWNPLSVRRMGSDLSWCTENGVYIRSEWSRCMPKTCMLAERLRAPTPSSV